MSTVEQAQTDVDAAIEVSEETVADYLQAHPDFFERHSNLLTSLQLPHQTGGPAISLVERQVAVLRQQNAKLERNLHELVDVARGNELLAGKIHALAMLLVVTQKREETVTILEEQLRTSFGADRSVLVLFSGPSKGANEHGEFLRLMNREDPAIGSFKTFLQANSPRCGSVRDAQKKFLFGADDLEIGSVALIPLGPKSELGFMAVGSRNADHFHPGKSIDFLTRLGDLVTCALKSG